MFATYTKAEGQVVADENASVADKVVDVLTAPISFSDTELVTKSNRAVSVLAWGTVMAIGGELMGHHRAARGQKAFFPLFRPS